MKTKRILKKWLKTGAVRLNYYSRPSFLLIGAQKAGTSALFSILGQHPQIVQPDQKEVYFFGDGKYSALQYGDFDAYHRLFPLPFQLKPDKITFEATPMYLFHPKSPARIHSYNPDMKLLAVLREPVARAYSAWNMYCKFTHMPDSPYYMLAERRSFADAVQAELTNIATISLAEDPIGYVKRGIYVNQLKNYFQYFPKESFCILNYADLLEQPAKTLAQISRFLGIDDQFQYHIEHRNTSTYAQKIPEDTAARLKDFYQPHNEALFQLVGSEFDW